MGACGGFVGTDADSNGSGSASESGSSGTSSTGNPSATDPTQASSEGTGTTNPVDPTDPTNVTSPTDPTETTTGPDETTTGMDTDTASTTTSETEGEASTTMGAGESTTTGPPVCEQDDMEPNDELAAAVFIGDQDCGDPAQLFNGTLLDGTDTDWIEYFGFWDCGSNGPDPDHVVDVVDDNVQVCVTPACQVPTTAFYFCHVGDNWTDGENDFGCCSTTRIEMNVNCGDTSNESASGFVRVRPLEKAAECVDYQLEISVLDQ